MATTDFPVPGPPSTIKNPLGAGLSRLCEVKRRLIDDLLIVDQLEFPVALEQRDEMIDETLRGLEPAVVDSVEDSRAVAGADVAPQKLAEPLDVVPDESRRPRRMLVIEGRVDGRTGRQVVQIGARPETYRVVLHGLVEIPDQRRVGPGLIGGMRDFALRTVDHGRHDSVLLRRLHLGPLLELDDHRVLVVFGIAPREDEVDTLRSERNLVLDRHTGVLGDLVAQQDVVHILH